MTKTLVVLAAGMGSRYGGMKQAEGMGPGGATILEYSVFDALRAGFEELVLLIRPDMEALFRDSVGARIEPRIATRYAFQTLADVPDGFEAPAGRTKPWGTAHAVLVSAPQVHGPFAVINADDFYGSSAFTALAALLDRGAQDDAHAMVAYNLRDTLTEAGTVSRGVCRVTPESWLESIVETVKIERQGGDARYPDAHGRMQTLSGALPVSMNCWGFQPSLFAALRDSFGEFLREHGQSAQAECYLPSVVQGLIRSGRGRVRVERSRDVWCGVTHPQDKPRVQVFLEEQVRLGKYPRELWT